MPITMNLFKLAQAHGDPANVNDKALTAIIHDALIEAGYPKIADFHFGQRIGHTGCCHPGQDCDAIAAILEENTSWMETMEERGGI